MNRNPNPEPTAIHSEDPSRIPIPDFNRSVQRLESKRISEEKTLFRIKCSCGAVSEEFEIPGIIDADWERGDWYLDWPSYCKEVRQRFAHHDHKVEKNDN